MVLSEMERLALCSIREVMSVFKGRHEFNRKIRNSKKQVKVFPGGADKMILPRKLSSHGSIQKEKVVLRYRCKTGQMLSQCCPEASTTPSPPPHPEDFGMSFIEQSGTPRENRVRFRIKC